MDSVRPPAARRLFRRFLRDRRGSPSIEFALASVPLSLAIIGTIEVGMILFATTLMESGLRDAARFGITGATPDTLSRQERIIEIVENRTLGLVDLDAADFEVVVYPAFSDIGRGEPFVDGDGSGAYETGETFVDENGNGVWDADIAAAGAGNAGDVVVYRIQYDWPLFTPLAATVLGTDGAIPLSATVAVRNEPWDGLDL